MRRSPVFFCAQAEWRASRRPAAPTARPGLLAAARDVTGIPPSEALRLEAQKVQKLPTPKITSAVLRCSPMCMCIEALVFRSLPSDCTLCRIEAFRTSGLCRPSDPITPAILRARDLPSPNPGPKVEEVLEKKGRGGQGQGAEVCIPDSTDIFSGLSFRLLLVAVVVPTSVSALSSVLRRSALHFFEEKGLEPWRFPEICDYKLCLGKQRQLRSAVKSMRVFLSETFRGVRVQKGSGRRLRDSARGLHAPKRAMPQTKEKLLWVTAVPAGWPLATVIDAFAQLAVFANVDRAREVVSHRLVDLWASQPAEAQAWLERCRGLCAKELADQETRLEELEEALLRHGAAEYGKYGCVVFSRFSEAGLPRGEPQSSAADRECHAAMYLQHPHVRARCRELAERLAAAESQETARKRQKLDEETSERRRLEAELHTSQEQECRELSNRLAAVEAEMSGKDAELQAAQCEGAKCKEQCEELATRAAAAESAVAKMRQELLEVQASQGESGQPVAKVVLRDRCEQLQQQLAKAQGQMQVCWEEKGMQKQRIRELEHQLVEAMQRNPLLPSGATVARQLGDGSDSSALSNASWFTVSRGTVKPHCFMTDAVFKTRSYGADFFLSYGADFFIMGRDLKNGSQVVAGDDVTILKVAKTPEICEASEVVELRAGDAVLQVTSDHLVATGEPQEIVYRAAGQLKVGDLVMLDSGEAAALTSVATRRMARQVLKIQFEPDLPVAVFSRPTCILSLGHKRKPPIRRGGRGPKVPRSADDGLDRASIPDTINDYMD